MKKIEIKNEKEVLKALKRGVVEGRLALVKTSDGRNMIEFVAYNRKPQTYRADKLICLLENGWVKESAQRIKVHESLDKHLGTARIVSVLERDMRDAKNALINRELEECL
jgi:hypothetical protein